ncbi:ATP-dependent zinc protease family protein [Vibrio agarivorans]|uniref:RimK/LysX family protein n=1 Tax=Vibrio agarivorans TaxID=153622 RepID=A0ABT7Y0B3_9VIBR|nr:RimK/LysX family protein [Vibrio agarivorans]MDN2481441.1 RimK/LysX family protein [Vibrio agarivorans]
MKKWTLAVMPLLFSSMSFTTQAESCAVDEMVVIGEKEFIYIDDLETHYRARIDTGATRTSLHAMNIEIVDGVEDLEANIGKRVRFITANEQGDKHQHQADIVAVRTIKNSLGTEVRYSIDMTLSREGESETVQVNLRDRGRMDDKLLIGRDWLRCRYLVDVNQNPTKSYASE